MEFLNRQNYPVLDVSPNFARVDILKDTIHLDILPRDTLFPARDVDSAGVPSARLSSRFADGRYASTDMRNSFPSLLCSEDRELFKSPPVIVKD